jgi:hypothetical protein
LRAESSFYADVLHTYPVSGLLSLESESESDEVDESADLTTIKFAKEIRIFNIGFIEYALDSMDSLNCF